MSPEGHDKAVPEFTLRHDRRVKRMKLIVTPEEGLIVSAPPHVSRDQAHLLVVQHLEWVYKAAGRVQSEVERRRQAPPTPLPGLISFPAIPGQRAVVYTSHKSPGTISWKDNPHQVEMKGDIADRGLVFMALRKYVIQQAARHLAPRLKSLASEMGLPYSRTKVGLQKTRWGSCSTKGTIAINAKLLFLRPELARHVMIHELAHTRHMNHSPQFWALVAKLDPDYQRHRLELREADKHIPAWLLAEN